MTFVLQGYRTLKMPRVQRRFNALADKSVPPYSAGQTLPKETSDKSFE